MSLLDDVRQTSDVFTARRAEESGPVVVGAFTINGWIDPSSAVQPPV